MGNGKSTGCAVPIPHHPFPIPAFKNGSRFPSPHHPFPIPAPMTSSRLRFPYLAGLVAVVLSTAPLAAQQTAITARRVFDGERFRENVSVVVEGNRIVGVGALPAGFRGARIDLGESTLMPGLIDVHAHVAWHFNAADRLHTDDDGETPAQAMLAIAGNAYATLMAGVTTIQSPGSEEDGDLRDAVARGAVPGPRILTSLGSLSERSGTPEELRARVRDLKARGADLIKLFASKSIREGGGQTIFHLHWHILGGRVKGLPV